MLNHPAFKPLPQIAQFAKNGAWETGWSFQCTTLPSRAEIKDYLAGTTEVAFETFFGEAFFGVRLLGESREVEALSFACIAALRAASDGANFFSRLSDNKAFKGLGQSISFTEIGAVNAWQSVGAFKTRPPREALGEFEALWSVLASTPLASNSSHPKAVEFAYLFPRLHWFALPVSSSLPPFALNPDQLLQALESAARANF